jgi:hypothetical protein
MIRLYRDQVARAGAVERLFARFDALLRAKRWLAMGGQIIAKSRAKASSVIVTGGSGGDDARSVIPKILK